MPLCGYNEDMAKGLALFVTGSTPTKETMMAWCGHNKDMASGVGTFSGGLALQTNKRAKDEGVAISSIPAIEIEEIDALMEVLEASPKKAELAGVRAIGSLIRFFYTKLDERLSINPTCSVESIFASEVGELNRLLFDMEAHYYEHLRPKHERLTAIRLIREYLEGEV
jgi:hypothetical protein